MKRLVSTASVRTLVSISAVFVFGQAFSRSAALLSLPIVSGSLTVAEFGHLSAAASLTAGLRIVLGLASSAAAGIVYFQEDSDAHRARVMAALHQLAAISALVAMAGAALTWTLKLEFFSLPPRDLSLSLVFLGVSLMSEPHLLELQFQKRPKPYVVAQACTAFAAALASIAAVIAAPVAASWFLAHIAVNAAMICAFMFYGQKGIGRLETATVMTVAKVGLPLVPGAAALFVMQAVAGVTVSAMYGMEEAGRFGVGYQLGAATGMLIGAIQSAWIPFFLDLKNAEPQQRMATFESVRWLYIAGIGIGLAAYVVAAELCIAWVFSAEYRTSRAVIAPIVMTQFLFGVWSLLLPNLYYAGQTHVVSGVQLVSAAVCLISMSQLGAYFGVAGVPIAQMLGAATMVAAQILYNRRQGLVEDQLGPGALIAIGALGGLAVFRSMLG